MNQTPLPAQGPVDVTVGPETNTSGPRGTYGCACLDHDAVQCAAIRYGMDYLGEACECMCHQWRDDDGTDY